MKSKEALNNIRDYNTEVIHDVGSEYNENPLEEECNIIEKELEILEEIRNEIKVIDYGEKYQNRYAIQYIERGQVVIVELCKEDYDKWNRWLNNGK